MIIKRKFMAKPDMQVTLRKEIFSRIKLEFNVIVINFARREVHVIIPEVYESEHLTEEHKAAEDEAAAYAVNGRRNQQWQKNPA